VRGDVFPSHSGQGTVWVNSPFYTLDDVFHGMESDRLDVELVVFLLVTGVVGLLGIETFITTDEC